MSEEKKYTDLHFLQSMTGGQNDKITKYIRMFMTGAPQNMTQMELHLLSKDYDGVRQAAHALKPQLNYFGARDTEEMAKHIEHCCYSMSELDRIPEMVQTFRNNLDQVMKELEEALKTYN